MTRYLVTFLFVALLCTVNAAEPLVGKFSTVRKFAEQNDLFINIGIWREGTGYQLGLQALGGRALHGHAPEGAGHGEIKGGVFHFQFQDSFSNRGSGTFRRVRDHYVLHIDISEVAVPGTMAAYGNDIPMHRDKP